VEVEDALLPFRVALSSQATSSILSGQSLARSQIQSGRSNNGVNLSLLRSKVVMVAQRTKDSVG
jgi:hypothetical protein